MRIWVCRLFFMEQECEQFSVHLQAAVVIDEAQLAKTVHKEANSRPRSANHLGQGSLAHLQDGWMWLGLCSKARKREERSRQPPLAGIKELIEEVFFNSDNARKQVRDKHPREHRVVMDEASDCRLLHAHDYGHLYRRRGGHPQRQRCP